METVQPNLPALSKTFDELVPAEFRCWFNSDPPAELARGLILRYSGQCVPEQNMLTANSLKGWVVEHCQAMIWSVVQPGNLTPAPNTLPAARPATRWVNFDNVTFSCVETGTCTYTHQMSGTGYSVPADQLRIWIEEALADDCSYVGTLEHIEERLRQRMLEDPPEVNLQNEEVDNYNEDERDSEEVDTDDEDFDSIVRNFLNDNPDLRERFNDIP